MQAVASLILFFLQCMWTNAWIVKWIVESICGHWWKKQIKKKKEVRFKMVKNRNGEEKPSGQGV